MRFVLLAGILFCWLHSLQAQRIFVSTTRRLQLIDSLGMAMQRLTDQPRSFSRDTALFFTIDRYNYHYFEINRPFDEKMKKMVYYPDSMYRIAQRRRWPMGLALSLIRRGNAVSWLGDKASAVQLYEQALDVCRQHKLINQQSAALLNLAVCYSYRKNPTKQDQAQAIAYMEEARKLAMKTGDIENIHQYYNLMGDFHVIRKEYALALPFYEAERPILLKHHYESGLRTNGAYLGICYLNLGRERQAWPYLTGFFSRNRLDEGSYATYLHHIVLTEMANYFLHQRVDFRRALIYQQQYEVMAGERPLFDRVNHYEAIVKIYAGLKQYDKAFAYQQRYMHARDSLKLEETGRRFADIQNQLVLQRKENQIRLLQNQSLEEENKTQRNRFLFMIFLLGSLATIGGLLFYGDRLKIKAAKAELLLTETRNEANSTILNAQETERRRIAQDLHDDIGTSLIALRGKLPADNVEAQHLINQLITDVRTVSHNLMPDELTTLGLVGALGETSRRLQESSGIRFMFVCAGEVVALTQVAELAVYRAVLELMHNIIRHSQATEAIVQLVYHSDLLNITIEDNGKGFEQKNTGRASGIGLKNVASRTEWLGGSIAIDSSVIGTTIRLDIPYV